MGDPLISEDTSNGSETTVDGDILTTEGLFGFKNHDTVDATQHDDNGQQIEDSGLMTVDERCKHSDEQHVMDICNVEIYDSQLDIVTTVLMGENDQRVIIYDNIVETLVPIEEKQNHDFSTPVNVGEENKIDIICRETIDETLFPTEENGSNDFITPVYVGEKNKIDIICRETIDDKLVQTEENGSNAFSAPAYVGEENKIDIICRETIDDKLVQTEENGSNDFSAPVYVGEENKIDMICRDNIDETLVPTDENGSNDFSTSIFVGEENQNNTICENIIQSLLSSKENNESDDIARSDRNVQRGHKRSLSSEYDHSYPKPPLKKPAFGPSKEDFYRSERSNQTEDKHALMSSFTFERGNDLISFVDEPFSTDIHVSRTLMSVINTIIDIFSAKKTNKKQFDNEIDLAVIRLMVLEERTYRGVHKELPDMVKRIVNSLERPTKVGLISHVVNHLSPLECTMIGRDLLSKKCRFFKFELAKTVCASPSVNCNFYFDIKFMFIGTMERNGSVINIIPSQTFGQYLNDSMYTLYDYVYDVVNREVEREQSRRQSNDAFLLERLAHGDSEDITSLRKIMDNIILPLAKRDYRIHGTSGGQKGSDNKLQFTLVSEEGTVVTRDEIDENTEAIFVTSYIRPRIMSDGSLSLQIYTRKALALSSHDVSIKPMPKESVRMATLVEHVKKSSLQI